MTPQKFKKVVKLSTILVTTFVLCMACIITYQCIKIGVLKARSRELDRLSASLTQQQNQLEAGIKLKETGSYLEQQAREEYGMAQKGDTIYIPNK